MKNRPNQKNRRRPARKVGQFVNKSGAVRNVELHPTKGFREFADVNWRGHQANNRQQIPGVFLNEPHDETKKAEVVDNTPKVSHRKSG